MSVGGTKLAAAPFLLGVAFALIGAWNLEAWIVGLGVISMYVAPIGLIALAAVLMLTQPARR